MEKFKVGNLLRVCSSDAVYKVLEVDEIKGTLYLEDLTLKKKYFWNLSDCVDDILLSSLEKELY